MAPAPALIPVKFEPSPWYVVAHTAPAAVAVTIPARVTLNELSPATQRPVPQPIAN